MKSKEEKFKNLKSKISRVNLLTGLLLLCMHCSAQKPDGDQINFISNKKISFAIVIESCDTCAPIQNIGYRVKVELSEKSLVEYRKIEKELWLKLLENPETDFAANLILYDLYDMDAVFLSLHNSEDEWRRLLKVKDIAIWKEHLE